MEPGTVFSFPLENGLLGTCRVLRGPEEDLERERYTGFVLVHGTRWIGEGPIDLKHKDLRKVMPGRMSPLLWWIEGKVPDTFCEEGVVSVRKAEAAKKSNARSGWDSFPNTIFQQWKKGNDPEAFEAQRKKNRQQTETTLDSRLENLKKTESIDLSRFVPLKKPKVERTPEEIVKGFIAAMNQWEKECDRIAKKHPNTPVVGRFNVDAMQTIFDEFCTTKERKYGRHGSYQIPPEYDPRQEKVIEVRKCNRSRIEVNTQAADRKYTYVLLKKKGVWLIDNRKKDGEILSL